MRVSSITGGHQTGKTWTLSWYAYPLVFSPASYSAHRLNFPYNSPWQKHSFKNQTPCSGATAVAVTL